MSGENGLPSPPGKRKVTAKRAKRPTKRTVRPGTNAEALALWLENPGAVALIALAETLAKAVDADPDSAPLAREYRMALQDLRALHDAEGADDGEAAVIRSLSAAVVDTKAS